jgi:hypothetical protein
MRILRYKEFSPVFEKIGPITANWYIVNDESSFDKKEEGGYLVFNQRGNFTIMYQKKGNKEESRLDFFPSKESSPDGKTLCECQIIKNTGDVDISKKFQEINSKNIWEIISVFFDYCDLEKQDKNVVDRFLMGFCKCLKEIKKHDSKESLPASFNFFQKNLEDNSKKLDPSKFPYNKDFKIISILKDFIKYFNKLN